MKNNTRAYRPGPFGPRFLSVILTISMSTLLLSVDPRLDPIPSVEANSVYFNLTFGNLNFSVTPATANQITSNDDWSGVNSVEGYKGLDLTTTHGVDPQTVLNTEFAGNQLPNSPTNVAANKGNPSAFNAGGVAEFDGGTYLAMGVQGNVQANPYLVFYLNTTGRTNVTVNYTIQDIDGGANDSVSRVALQYRVGETSLFTNVPAGFIADATDGGVAGRTANMSVPLPAAVNNQSKVQVRLITTNAANTAGASTPDEWIGVNNVVITSAPGPSAAGVYVGGRVLDPSGRPVRGAILTMYDATGLPRSAVTNSFGYYRFSDVEIGATYNFVAVSKRYSFTPRTVTIVDELTDLNFIGNQ
jgi:hypothetical protein